MSADPFNFGQPNNVPGPQPGGPPAPNPLAAPTRVTPAFGPATPAAPDLVASKPPAWLLFVAAGVALVAGIVALLLDNPVIAIVCWVLAGPVGIGLIALFVVKDTFARSSGLYAAPGWVKPMHYGAIALCLLCILAPALRIADWVGRL